MSLKETFLGWIRDLAEVIGILLIIIIVSKLLFGARLLIPLVAVTSQSMVHSDAVSYTHLTLPTKA